MFALFDKLRRLVPTTTDVIVLADREFGTLNNMKKLKERLNFDYILRIKRNFTVTDSKKEIKKLAYQWLNRQEATCVEAGYVTVQNYPVEKIVIAKEPKMKDICCLVCSKKNIATQTILTYYGKRWGTETSYRDEKDLQFGMGLKKSHIKNIERRDRLLLISAIAIIFFTLLGAASEAVGFDRYIKANMLKCRTHSLFTQGRVVLELLPNLAKRWKIPIIRALLELVKGIKSITSVQYVV